MKNAFSINQLSNTKILKTNELLIEQRSKEEEEASDREKRGIYAKESKSKRERGEEVAIKEEKKKSIA